MQLHSKDTHRSHFYMRLIKSALRMIAGISLIQGSLLAAGALIMAAEILGIAEELV